MKLSMRVFASLTILLGFLGLSACTSQQRIESAPGSVAAKNTPVPTHARHRTHHPKALAEISQEQARLVQDEILGLPAGLVTFETPPALRKDTAARLEARLSPEFPAKLSAALAANTRLSGIKVLNAVSLQLEAPGMDLKALSAPEQSLGKDPGVWAWQATPKEKGRHPLRLLLTLRLVNKAGEKNAAYPVVERTVDVQEAEAGFFKTYGWWILAVALVLAAVLLLLKKP